MNPTDELRLYLTARPMAPTRELELYLAVSDCRTRIMRGYPPEEAAALSVRGRDTGLLAEEVKLCAVTAVHECADARRRKLAAGGDGTSEPLSPPLAGDLAVCAGMGQG